jgi:PAS domain S-box-containing protein
VRQVATLALGALRSGDAAALAVLESFGESAAVALVRWDGSAGAAESLPPEASSWLPPRPPAVPRGSWVFLDPSQVPPGAAGVSGLVAYFSPEEGRWQALVLDLPRLLLGDGLGEGQQRSWLLALKLPGGLARFFSCERVGFSPRDWRCSPQGAPTGKELAAVPWGEQVPWGDGVLLTHSLVVAGGSLGLGIWVPEAGFASRASPGWVVLVLLALLASSGGLALRQGLLAKERQQAGLAADLARRERELAAQIAEEQWRLLLEGVKEPMLFLRDEFVIRANQAAARLLGFEHPGDCIGRRFLDLVAAEEQGRVAKLLPAVAASLGSFTTYLRGRNGKRRTVEIRPWKLEAGEEVLTALSLTDHTARERAESLLRVLLAHLGVGVAFLDRKGKVLWANVALAQAVGLRAEDLQQRELLPFASPTAWRAVRRAFARGRRGQEQALTVPCRLAGEVVEPVHLAMVPVPVAGEVGGVLLVAARPGVADPEGRVGEAMSLVEAVVARQTHRCANILQAILAHPPKGRGAALARQRALEELAQALRQMSALFRVPGSGGSPLELNGLLESAGASLAAPAAAYRAPVAASLARAGLGPGQPGAGGAFPAGGLRGGAAGHRRGGGHRGARRGAPAFGAAALGGGGYRGSVPGGWEASRHVPGAALRSRLGLARGPGLGGEAGFRERPGFGARVWIELPAAAVHPSPQLQPGAPRPGKILVADDEPSVRESLAQALGEAGYEVVEAADGRQAVELFQQDPASYGLVVLDLVMPEMDGRAVYQELAKSPTRPAVLLATGYAPRQDPLLAELPVLLKPFTLEAFLREVERLLGAGGQATAASP